MPSANAELIWQLFKFKEATPKALFQLEQSY